MGAAHGMTSSHQMNYSQSHDIHHMNPLNTKSIDTSFITLEDENLKLLNEQLFPSGQKLKLLKSLKNESKKANFFRGTLEIKISELELIKGYKTKCFTYNGLFPGPKIEVYEGDTVEILVKNHLPENTTVHWHGLPVPPKQDGNPHDPIPAGQEKVYRFTLPKDCAGTYWYHPHSHFTSAKQVYMGLAGVFVVKSKKDALSHLREQDWMFSDLRLDEKAQIPHNSLKDWLNGREGEFVLINGQFKPKIFLKDAQRIRIYNCCSARYLNLSLNGANFLLVGTDGGLIEKPIPQETLLLSPASRVEVLIQSDKKGEFELQNLYYDRSKMLVKEKSSSLALASIKIEKTLKSIPHQLKTFQPLVQAKESKAIVMSEAHMMMDVQNQETLKENLVAMFLINNKVFDIKRIDFKSKQDEPEIWSITNRSHMDHPFHIHGTQFELISSEFEGRVEKAPFRTLKDTINVRPRETVKIQLIQSIKGVRMFHCHILEHESLGMMGTVEVV